MFAVSSWSPARQDALCLCVASAEAQPGRGQPPGRPGLTPSLVRGVSGCWLVALRLAWLHGAPMKFLSMRLRHSSHLQTHLLTDAGSPAGRRHSPCGSGNRPRARDVLARGSPLLPPACSVCREPLGVLLPPLQHPEATRPPRCACRMPAGRTLAHSQPPWLRRLALDLGFKAAGLSSKEISPRVN